jgi:hypothetical protein
LEEAIGLSSDYVVKSSSLVAEMSTPAVVITHCKYLRFLSLRYTHRNTKLVSMLFLGGGDGGGEGGGIPTIALISICSFVLLP